MHNSVFAHWYWLHECIETFLSFTEAAMINKSRSYSRKQIHIIFDQILRFWIPLWTSWNSPEADLIQWIICLSHNSILLDKIVFLFLDQYIFHCHKSLIKAFYYYFSLSVILFSRTHYFQEINKVSNLTSISTETFE